MTTEKRDPRLLTAERLASVRRLSDTRTYFHERHYGSPTDEMLAMRDLLAHIDAITAENAELRARAERAEAILAEATDLIRKGIAVVDKSEATLAALRAEAERVAAGETDGQALARLVLEATKP